MNLFETLNTLGRRINRWYPNVNHGGCCVFASTVCHELLKRGVKARAVVANSFEAETDVNSVRERVNNTGLKDEWNAVGIFFNHVGVEFRLGGKWFLYDSDGVNPRGPKLGRYHVHPGYLSADEATALADESEGWNDDFPRSSIPSMKKHIADFLDANLLSKVVDRIPS